MKGVEEALLLFQGKKEEVNPALWYRILRLKDTIMFHYLMTKSSQIVAADPVMCLYGGTVVC